MATGEWASETALMQFVMDIEELCTDEEQCRPPQSVDVVELGKQRIS